MMATGLMMLIGASMQSCRLSTYFYLSSVSVVGKKETKPLIMQG